VRCARFCSIDARDVGLTWIFVFRRRRRTGKSGYVYKLGLRNGKANVDEYSPIYLPQDFKSDGDKYEGNLLYWAVTVAGIIGSGALAIYLTSAL
jgi:photosystem II 10kDa protein